MSGGGVIGCVLVGAGVVGGVGDLAFSDCQWCSAAFSASSTFYIPFTKIPPWVRFSQCEMSDPVKAGPADQKIPFGGIHHFNLIEKFAIQEVITDL